jgi:uncharacterized membrane protein YphA (DoxX/SURF4 family)
MDITLWILQGLLAAVFAGAGLLKLTRPLESLAATLGGWVHDVPLPVIRTVGALEIAAGFGLILPGALDIAPFLTWLAAAGLIATMIGALVVHARRHEPREVAVNVVLVVLASVIVWGRIGPYAF